MNLPALCAELRFRLDGSIPVVNSRDVAEFFDKRHAHVLRDIDALKINPDLERSWFRPATVLDAYGREQPSFDLTRQGFTLLAMGWTGERAMAFKIRYIQAFDEMEAFLKQDIPPIAGMIISGLKEAIAPLAVRLADQDGAIERVERRIDSLSEDVASIKLRLANTRRKITDPTKREHADAVRLMGGRCPCCGEAEIITDEAVSPFAEYDHFYANSFPNVEHTWLICRRCHTGLTTGRIPRDQREAEFRAYQNKRRRLPGRQITLFG